MFFVLLRDKGDIVEGFEFFGMLVFLACAFDLLEESLDLVVFSHLRGMRVFLLVLHFQRVLRPPFYFFFEKLIRMLGQLILVLAEDGVLLCVFNFVLILDLQVHEHFNASDLVNQTEPVQVHQFPLLVLE